LPGETPEFAKLLSEAQSLNLVRPIDAPRPRPLCRFFSGEKNRYTLPRAIGTPTLESFSRYMQTWSKQAITPKEAIMPLSFADVLSAGTAQIN
jgi:hypothetical protein